MSNKLLAIAILVVAVSILANSFITAKNTATFSIKPEIEQIMRRLESIEEKTSSLEDKQDEILKSVKTSKPALRDAAKGMFPPVEDFSKEYKIDVGHSSILGNKKAKVTIVEFSDFQCPFSKRFHAIIPEVIKAYPKDVRFIFKNFPLSFHQQARPAAKAAFAAREQSKYWEMVELLFENSRQLNEEKYKELAGQLGLNVDQFMKDYKEKDSEWDELIKKDMILGGSADVKGTPTFYINGRKTRARDLGAFKAEINSIIGTK